uniref:Uncharacterized protein LOC114331582 n=1 Tax=Diabrotica virgifera virgifera TaxID=50390 RepID=A0A6P7FVM5_DIAVI
MLTHLVMGVEREAIIKEGVEQEYSQVIQEVLADLQIFRVKEVFRMILEEMGQIEVTSTDRIFRVKEVFRMILEEMGQIEVTSTDRIFRVKEVFRMILEEIGQIEVTVIKVRETYITTEECIEATSPNSRTGHMRLMI